ncbi:MAG: hypothetical protein ACRDGT_01820 [Candidatus Limnocylindria bacterium]
MRITVAGHGAVGRYVAGVFGARHEIAVYDPPQGETDEGALRDTDFVFVCVPTPPRADGSCDTSLVEELVARSSPARAIVCESTVSIGTTERLIRTYRKPLVFVPEYAGESPDHPYRDPGRRSFFIYGGYEPEVSAVHELFEGVYPGPAAHHVVAPTVAETVKYMENAFLALKVAFCNDFYDLCERLGIDYGTVRGLWLEDERIGASHTLVTAERGYGGRCLPKDVLALCALARDLGVPQEIMESVHRANLRHRQAPSREPELV